ncbi:MAG: ethylbenzene dehydrogenase-related protein [Rhodoferax sp.]
MSLDQASPAARVKKTDAPTVFWHAALLLFMLLAFSTGMRVALDNAKGGWRAALEPLLLQGDVLRWHAWAALALAALVCGYIAFLAVGALSARWRVSRQLMRVRNPQVRWQSINRLLYWLGLALFAAATASGVWLYFLPFWGFVALATQIHEWSCWALVGYLLLHVLAQFKLGGLWQLLKVFIPKRDYAQAGGAMATVALAGALGFWGLDWSATRAFQAVAVDTPPVLDGLPDDAAWKNAAPIAVNTTHGWNMGGGETRIEARAVLHGDRIYIQAQWNDDTRSYMRLPLQKTAEGWVRMVGDTPGQTYDDADTTDYYEDKFAVAISPRNNPFAGSWHFGPSLMDDLRKPLNGRGYHYTEDGSVVDLWHWKASRSGATHQAEDSWFGTPVKFDPEKHAVRYSAGYASDKKDNGSGYQDNFEKGKHGWPVKHPSHIVTPLFLPKDLAALQARLGSARTAFESHGSEYNLGPDEIVAYTQELDDQIPVGTIIPALYWKTPMAGPAGDVAAMGHWENGRWTLEFSRTLAAPDAQDVAIKDGVYLWFAAFNHNQTRHSWHAVPVRLRLPPPTQN